jgi:hypothetical protein
MEQPWVRSRGGISPRGKNLNLGRPLPEPYYDRVVTSRKVTDVSTDPAFGKWPVRAIQSLRSGIPLPGQAPYLRGEQFWGRAVRASRDPLDSGRFLFVAKCPQYPWVPTPLRLPPGLPSKGVCGHRHLFTFSRGQAAIGSVQNQLVLPALLARYWKHLPTFDRGSKGVHLP